MKTGGTALYIASNIEANILATIRDIVLIGSALVVVLLLYIWIHRHTARPLFAYVVAGTSFIVLTIITMSAVVLHLQSDSIGRQHRQANVEFWVCGTEVTPFEQRNRLGDGTFYYQSTDKQITRSGYVSDELHDASLGAFFQTAGGSIQADSIVLPLSNDPSQWLMPSEQQDGDAQGNMTSEFLERYVRTARRYSLLELSDGLRCPDGSTGELQVFSFRIDYDNQTYQQEKIVDPDDLIIEPANSQQPNQCLIIEFAENKNRTNKLCESIGLRDSLRCSEFGVERFSDDTCYFTEITSEEGQ